MNIETLWGEPYAWPEIVLTKSKELNLSPLATAIREANRMRYEALQIERTGNNPEEAKKLRELSNLFSQMIEDYKSTLSESEFESSANASTDSLVAQYREKYPTSTKNGSKFSLPLIIGGIAGAFVLYRTIKG